MSRTLNAVPLLLLVLLPAGGPAQAGGLGQADRAAGGRYTFTTILDSQRDGLTATRCAAINSAGTVAVQVIDAEGIRKLVTKAGASDAPVVVADTRSVPDFPTFCDNGITLLPSDPSINELGEVAFQGNLRRLTTRAECGTTEQRARRQGVFLGRGGPLTTIAHTINPPGGSFISEFLVADQSVNTLGRVALVPELDDGDAGLFVGSRNGTFETRFLVSGGEFDGISSRVSLNELGQVAFEGSKQASPSAGIFRSNPDGTFTTIVDTSTAEISSAGDPSLNILGRVAFTGSRFVNDVQILGIYTGRGGPLTTVVENTGEFDSFREPSLNDLGDLAFTADLDELGADGRLIQGVFTGARANRDRVIQAGDTYDGVPVTSVVSCNEALNNRGQIAMTVQSEDPSTFDVRTFVVRATPRR